MSAAESKTEPEVLAWCCQWTLAFPTLVSSRLFVPEHDVIWQRLAWQQIWEDSRLEDTTTTRRHGSQNDRLPTEWNNSLGYGEITQDSVWYILEMIRNDLPPKPTVVDLGSGNGRVLLAAALGHCFHKAIGIEIVPELHHQALLNYQECWHRFVSGDTTVFDWKCADFTVDLDWTNEADIVFCHATVFEQDLVEALNNLALCCQPGTFFCMVSRPLSKLTIVCELSLAMDWGQANVYLQRLVPV